MISMWHKEKEILQEKDFRGDAWRLAQRAFMDGLFLAYTKGNDEIREKVQELMDKLPFVTNKRGQINTAVLNKKTAYEDVLLAIDSLNKKD